MPCPTIFNICLYPETSVALQLQSRIPTPKQAPQVHPHSSTSFKGEGTSGSFLKPEQPELADTHTVSPWDSENQHSCLEVRTEPLPTPAQVTKM